MTNDIQVKICGLRSAADVAAAAQAGAAYGGFVFFPRSPRHLSLDSARALCAGAPPGLQRVALTVDADDDTLAEIVTTVPLDWLQLHGSESPARVAAVRSRFALPVMKALGVADSADLAAIDRYSSVADQLLIDAKPPRDAIVPGGNGLSFDWRLIAGRDWTVPWMLAGGLTTENVAEAIRLTGARQVDVSSGVESTPGEKDQGVIAAFVHAASAAGRS